ncbi:unnamed protein product [Schistosoma margrebowiei]|uniref:DUF1619 domain-containing protein n=1 Tax=Schistosoma margrebowiei TaxID=48269 RepID=A0AA84Z916_9TREM|nr:unnamed protein product [Schistosoma margrebowiei]
MAPRTFRWSKRDCLSPDTETINLVALVFEDSELLEAEAAELSVDESDDSFSLLIRNDSLFGEINPEEYSTLPRSQHSNLSAHSLATISIVTPTHHAQTIKFNLISTSQFESSESNSNDHKSHSPSSFIDIDRIHDFLSTLPVHVLNISTSFPCSPSSWPWHLLAYTDFPAFVHAITSDLNCFWNLFNGNTSKHSNFVDIIPCDSAFDLTTCNLTCQAEVELVQCDDTFIQTNYQMKCINPSTSTPTNEKDSAIITHKCLQTSQKLVPFFCAGDQLKISDEMNIVLFPLSGLHPNLLNDSQLCHSTFTAVYLLLINDDSKPEINTSGDISNLSTNHVQNTKGSCDYGLIDDTFTDKNDQLHNTPIVLALLVQILPSKQLTCPITVNHKLCPFPVVSDLKLFNGQEFTVLLAVVDLLVSKNDDDEFQLHGILHQRLNYLSDFKFELFLHNQP